MSKPEETAKRVRVKTVGRVLGTMDCEECGRQIVILVVVDVEGAVDDIAVSGVPCVCGATYSFEVNKISEVTN